MKRLLCSSLPCLLAAAAIDAQTSNWLAASSYGDFDDDRSTCIITDADGNVFVTGYFASPTITFDTITLTNVAPGTYDIFIVKFNASGDVVWARSWGGTGFDYSNSISLDPLGNIFMTGNFRSPTITFGTTTLTNAGVSYDVMVARFDPLGNPLWAKRAGGVTDETCPSITTVAGGGAVITGYFTSASITFGPYTLTNALNLNADLFVVRYDSSGTVQWAKRAGGTFGDYGISASSDGNDNVYVTGHFGSTSITFGSTTLTNASTNATLDVFLAKYDAAGNVTWAERAGGTADDKSNCVCYSIFGYVYICGYFASPTIAFGTTTLSNAGIWDMYIARYGLAGGVNWATGAGGTGFDVCQSLTVLPLNGSVFGTGYFDSPTLLIDATTLTNVSSNDVFVTGYTMAGAPILAASAGGLFAEEGASICADADGNLLVTGPFSSGSLIFGEDTLANLGSNDLFIAGLSSNDLSTGMPGIAKGDWTLFPNPAHDQVQLSAATSGGVLRVTDAMGRLVEQRLITGGAVQLNVGTWAPGIYLLSVHTEEGRVQRWLMVE